MHKVVLDTNVLVSSLLASGPPAVIIDLVADGRIIPFYNELIIQEYWEVLSRKKFGFSPFRVTRLIHDIARSGIAIEYKQAGKKPILHEDDRIFYETAVDAHAYLITGNMRHFPKDSFVISPAQFLVIFNKTSGIL